jgi:hypothetical protein
MAWRRCSTSVLEGALADKSVQAPRVGAKKRRKKKLRKG